MSVRDRFLQEWRKVGLHCVLPVDKELNQISLGFDVDGSTDVIRIRLDVADAETMISVMQDYIDSHSDKSAEILSETPSNPSEEKILPVAASCAAAEAE